MTIKIVIIFNFLFKTLINSTILYMLRLEFYKVVLLQVFG